MVVEPYATSLLLVNCHCQKDLSDEFITVQLTVLGKHIYNTFADVKNLYRNDTNLPVKIESLTVHIQALVDSTFSNTMCNVRQTPRRSFHGLSSLAT